jgi:hypothetical protein
MSSFRGAMRRVFAGDAAGGPLDAAARERFAQRGADHAWQAHGGPGLFPAVLIDRQLTLA